MRSVAITLGICVSSLAISILVIFSMASTPKLRPSPGSDKDLPGTDVVNKLGTAMPLDTLLRDEKGEPITLGQAMQNRPTLLVFGYFHCPQLCNRVLTDLVDRMRQLTYSIGKDFNVVTISIDPKESPLTAWAWRKNYTQQYGREGAEDGWRFLSAKQPEIALLTETAGFRYEEIDKPLFQPVGSERKNKEYSHPAVVTVLRPDGVINRYLFGLNWTAQDLKYSLIDSNGELGEFKDKVILSCFMSYDTHRGEYTFQVWKLMQITCLWTVMLIVVFVGRAFWNGSSRVGPTSRSGGGEKETSPAVDLASEG